MIQNDNELRVTQEQLAVMYRALTAINRERARYSDAWLAVLMEGPLDEIRTMEADIRAYTGRDLAETLEAPLWLRVQGGGGRWPAASTSVLTTFLGTLRKGIQAGAEFIATGTLSTRPTQALRAACDLEVLGFQPGSVRIGLRLPEPEVEEDPTAAAATQALNSYVRVAGWVGSDEAEDVLAQAVPDMGLRRVLLTEVKRLAPRPRGGVERVELSGRTVGGPPVALTRSVHGRIDRALDSAATEVAETHQGDLRELDLDKRSLIVRNVDDAGLTIECAFDEDLVETAKQALDRRVEVRGFRPMEGGRRAPRLKVTGLTILDDACDDAPRTVVAG